MPAVTVDDITVLPRVPVPDPVMARQRPVTGITTAPRGFEGEGFPVRRAFAGVDLRDLDPFIHLDQMGEIDYGPGEPKGTPWHPHRGFETVTYMIDGIISHSDSLGGGGVISDGDTQWMTAGQGILHIETRPEEMVASGGCLPRAAAVGQPPRGRRSAPRGAEVGRPALPGPGRRAGEAAVLRRRWRAAARHRRGHRRVPRPRGRHTRRSPWCAPPSARARASTCHGSRSSTR
ncbi:pirin family protein [Pseudonocardia nigra]|uniref:pirin family protein n=1 Tax=Pseudonocardia nigra TaxID=1921578 RepID=UPI0027E384CF|nr:pirin family protein [Pseudonocardia nigra]